MSESGSGSTSGKRTITLTKLEDTLHYHLWRIATEATFDVYNVLNIVNNKEPKPTQAAPSTSDSSDTSKIVVINAPSGNKLADWERHHKLTCEAIFSALRPAQLI